MLDVEVFVRSLLTRAFSRGEREQPTWMVGVKRVRWRARDWRDLASAAGSCSSCWRLGQRALAWARVMPGRTPDSVARSQAAATNWWAAVEWVRTIGGKAEHPTFNIRHSTSK
jgi:hypothetical protein